MARLQFLLLALLWSALASAQPLSLEGRWRGESGPPDNHVNYALEFKRGAHNALTVRFYQDNLGYFGVGLGEVNDQGQGAFAIPGADLKLHLTGSSLAVSGLLEMPAEVVEFIPAQTLPSLSPLPELPSGPGPVWQLRLGGAI